MFEWEMLDMKPKKWETQRAKVPGGWLVRTKCDNYQNTSPKYVCSSY